MTLTDLYVLAGSAAVIAFMVGVAALLGFRRSVRLASMEDLARHLGEYEPDARLEAALLDSRGRAALARLADGRVLVARAMGDRVSLRAFAASAMRLRLRAGRLTATFGDLGFPQLDMALKDEAPPAWLVELAAPRAGGKT
jgi:hypothetical protein